MRTTIKKNDIFVSYAKVDNQPFESEDNGWVTTFINNLKNFLGKKLGHSDLSLWMDYELQDVLIPERIELLENSAILLLILSPGYLASPRCSLELKAFLNKVGKDSGCVFVVEHDVVKRPTELSDLLGYSFWIKNKDNNKTRTLAIPKPNHDREPEYYHKLDDLARELTDKLKTLKIPAVIPETTIFLAEVTDDLISQRDEIKRYLKLLGVEILPNKLYDFQTKAELETAIDKDLEKSTLFVQLLGPLCPQNAACMIQYNRAKKLGLPILQWRERDLDVNTIPDVAYRSILNGSTVMATGLVEFQQHITQSLKQDKTGPSSATGFVFVNARVEDMDLAHKIETILIQQGLECILPLENSDNISSAQIREDLNNNLQDCDAIIVLYNTNTDEVWVRNQVRKCRRAQGLREQPFKIIAICKHPEKSPLNIHLSNMHIIDCFPPSHNTCVSEFVGVL